MSDDFYTDKTGKFAICNKTLVSDINSLITINRMDIIVNLIYCKFYDRNIKSKFAHDLYINQKKIQLGDRLIEYSQNFRDFEEKSVSTKKGEVEWIEKINHLIDCIKNNTFVWEDNKRAIDMITINKKSNQLVRGAHRVALHYYFNKNIYSAYNEESHHIHKCTQIKNYEYVFNEFINLKKDALVFCLFPEYNNKQNDDFITNEIHRDRKMNLLYKKNIKLNENGFIYFLIILYQIHNINGVGNLNYNVIRNKLQKSFADGETTIYFIEKKCDRKHIINFKKNIVRKYIDNENNQYSFHVTDNHEETKNISQFVLNNNNIKFANLNNIAKFNKNYPSLTDIKNVDLNKKIDVREITKDILIDSDDYCVVGSKVLSLFGFRESRDVDIISKDLKTDNFDVHNEYFLRFLNMEPDDIIYNPNNHLYFFNVKCITPEMLLKFKENRYLKTHDGKDKRDMENLKSITNTESDKPRT